MAAAASAPVQDQEAQQASAQELQSLRNSLSQSEIKTRELESQLETLNKVSLLITTKIPVKFTVAMQWRHTL